MVIETRFGSKTFITMNAIEGILNVYVFSMHQQIMPEVATLLDETYSTASTI